MTKVSGEDIFELIKNIVDIVIYIIKSIILKDTISYIIVCVVIVVLIVAILDIQVHIRRKRKNKNDDGDKDKKI